MYKHICTLIGVSIYSYVFMHVCMYLYTDKFLYTYVKGLVSKAEATQFRCIKLALLFLLDTRNLFRMNKSYSDRHKLIGFGF